MKKITKRNIAEMKARMPRSIGCPMNRNEIEETPIFNPKKKSTHTGPANPRPEGPSRKRIVYDSWKNGETNLNSLYSLVEGIKESTMKSWVGSWKRGQNLPGGITE